MGHLLHFHKFFVNFSWETVIAVGLKVPIVFNNVKKSLWKHNQFTSASIKAMLFLSTCILRWDWMTHPNPSMDLFCILMQAFLHLSLLKANLKVVLCGAWPCHYRTWFESALSDSWLWNCFYTYSWSQRQRILF